MDIIKIWVMLKAKIDCSQMKSAVLMDTFTTNNSQVPAEPDSIRVSFRCLFLVFAIIFADITQSTLLYEECVPP
jgi:hypothetical protein